MTATRAPRQPVRVRLPVDALLVAVTLALVGIGLVMVLDSSYATQLDGPNHSAIFLFRKQLFGAGAGLVAMLVFLQVGYSRLQRNAVKLAVVGLLLLLVLFVPHMGVSYNGGHRWLNLPLVKFEPSELAKLTLIIYLARMLSRNDSSPRDRFAYLFPAIATMAVYVLAIEREPDLGTAVVLFMTSVTVMFIAGVQRKHIAMIGAVALLAAIAMTVGFRHRQSRIDVYVHPELYKTGIGFQSWHSRLAVGSGEWLGMGFGQGREKYFLPQGESDFIFATIAEETGFAGSIVVIGLLLVLGARAFVIAERTQDPFAKLLAAGIGGLICWQALINMGTATGLIPATGVPLPFISYGSTSLVVLMAEIGILLNIACHPTPPGLPVNEAPPPRSAKTRSAQGSKGFRAA